MPESELIAAWQRARQTIVVAQFAPTFLLIATVALFPLGLAETDLFVRLGAAGILLASGILGALVQFSSASEAQAIARDIANLKAPSTVGKRAVTLAPWMNVVKYVTPTIFVLIFIFLMLALFMVPVA